MSRELPMFPLGTVLFPRASLSLHVFEPRYRVMMHDCLRSDREFGVVLIERGSEVGGGDARFAVGTVARVVRSAELPDGRYAVSAVGIRRARVRTWLPDDPYPRADVEELDEAEAGAGADAARVEASEAFGRVRDLYVRMDPGVHLEMPDGSSDPVAASFELAAAAPLGPIDAQHLLEIDDSVERLLRLGSLLAEHARLLEAHLDDDR